MTNPPPVAPVEGHYARLRNGCVVGPVRKQYEDHYWFTIDLCDGVDWRSNGKQYRSSNPNPLDIIATISPADMQSVASGELERLRAALQNIRALAAKRQHEGGPDGNFKTIEEFAVYGLEGKNP